MIKIARANKSGNSGYLLERAHEDNFECTLTGRLRDESIANWFKNELIKRNISVHCASMEYLARGSHSIEWHKTFMRLYGRKAKPIIFLHDPPESPYAKQTWLTDILLAKSFIDNVDKQIDSIEGYQSWQFNHNTHQAINDYGFPVCLKTLESMLATDQRPLAAKLIAAIGQVAAGDHYSTGLFVENATITGRSSSILHGLSKELLAKIIGDKTAIRIDFRQAEPKIFAWLAGFELSDVYAEIGKRTDRQYNEKKSIWMAFQNGMGPVSLAKKLGIAEWQAKSYLQRLHVKFEPISHFWEKCYADAVRGKGSYHYSKNDLVMVLPSRRRIYYADCQKLSTKDRLIYRHPDSGPKTLYPSLLSSHITQAVCHDLLMHMCDNLIKLSHPVVFRRHDEALIMGGNIELSEIKAIAEKMPDWADGLKMEARVERLAT